MMVSSEVVAEMAPSQPRAPTEERSTSVESDRSANQKPETSTVIEKPPQTVSKVVECIDIDDDDVQAISPPPAKKTKLEENGHISSNNNKLNGNSATTTDVKKSPKAVASYDDLLDKVYDHVHSQVASKRDLGRKVMDIMLAAINQEVLNDPHSVRKLIIDKQLVLPNTISHPPSMYVHLLIEHDPEHLLTRIIQKLFGEEKPKESEQERLEKLRFKREFAAPAMTRVVAQIGQELVQEYTYGDIVHARNLPDMPKDIEGYKRVAEQLKPVWQSLKEKNAPYKSKYHVCRVCRFKTDSLIAFSKHQWTLHYDGKKYSCTMCPEFNNNVARIRKHYMDKHEIVPTANEEPSNRLDCPICEEDFKFKGELNNHLKDCKRQALSQRRILHPTENDKLAINQWLWTKPTLEPRVARTQPKPPQQPPKPVKQPVHVAPPHRPTLSAGPSHSRPPTLPPSASAASGMPQNITQLMPLIQSLNANPAALEKIKNEHPLVYRQLQTQLANLRNNPQALAQFRTMTPPVRPSTQTARKTTASNFPPPGGYSASSRAPVLQRAVPPRPALIKLNCEICDQTLDKLQSYLEHMQHNHKKLEGKTLNDMSQGAPLACSKCKDRFWCYDGLERHLVMAHGLVTQEFLRKAQNKQDGGRCQICKKQYAFNMLQHLVQEHNKNLCSAEIRYSCDVCQFSCTVYQELEEHLSTQHPKKGPGAH
jgi:hypothetical protein